MESLLLECEAMLDQCRRVQCYASTIEVSCQAHAPDSQACAVSPPQTSASVQQPQPKVQQEQHFIPKRRPRGKHAVLRDIRSQSRRRKVAAHKHFQLSVAPAVATIPEGEALLHMPEDCKLFRPLHTGLHDNACSREQHTGDQAHVVGSVSCRASAPHPWCSSPLSGIRAMGFTAMLWAGVAYATFGF